LLPTLGACPGRLDADEFIYDRWWMCRLQRQSNISHRGSVPDPGSHFPVPGSPIPASGRLCLGVSLVLVRPVLGARSFRDVWEMCNNGNDEPTTTCHSVFIPPPPFPSAPCMSGAYEWNRRHRHRLSMIYLRGYMRQ